MHVNESIRGRWIWDERIQDLVPADEYRRIPPKRSDIPAPMVIMDTMEPVQSMLDGNWYDSKAAIRATYRAAGVTEMGNEKQKRTATYKKDPKGIRTALEKAKARVDVGNYTEATKRKHV